MKVLQILHSENLIVTETICSSNSATLKPSPPSAHIENVYENIATSSEVSHYSVERP